MAKGLSCTLKFCLTCSGSREKEKTREPSKAYGLLVAILISSLSTVLKCSGGVLANQVKNFEDDIIVSSEKIVELYSSWGKGDITIQQVLLSSTIKAIRCIAPHVKDSQHKRLLDIVLNIMNIHEISPDIRADASTMACKLDIQQKNKYLPILEKNASTLISTLTTASIPFEEDNNHILVAYLLDLAAKSEVFQSKMTKRRCTVLATLNCLSQSSDSKTKTRALEFCAAIVSNLESEQCHSNLDILSKHLISFTRKESSDRLQLAGTFLLQQILSLEVPTPEGLIDVLRCLAYSSESDEVIKSSASAFCEGFRKEVEPQFEELCTLVDFTTFPYASVRTEALAAIAWATTKSDSVTKLLNDTDIVDNFTLIIRHGSKEDCTTALDIMRKLARSSLYHTELCCHVGFLREVVEFVTQEEVTNRSAHFYAVEMVLALLSNEENIQAFLPFRTLLPWLVSFVNATTADDDLKKPVVSVIVRLSQEYLKEI